MPKSPRTNYNAMKAAAASRNHDLSVSGRDIGALPPVSDPVRKARARTDPEFALVSYFPATFALELSDDQRTVIRKAWTAITAGGLFALAMPRGSGKTTICECLATLAILYGYSEFLLLIGASEPAAVEMLESIKTELESNEFLAADFPEVCVAIAALDGIANRCSGQLHLGQRTHIEWSKKQIVLPTIPGSPASGVILKVAGLTGRLRGMKFKRRDGVAVRPRLVIIDDPQTDASARSLSQCAKREKLLAGAVLGLAGPGQKISGIMPCTVIRSGDMADNILNREKHPEWNGERMKMVYAFPANDPLWQKYAEIRADSLRAGHGIADATDYYSANRDAMDAGAKIAWPARFEDGELSAIQNAMNLKIQDAAAFFAEYQNEPLGEKKDDDDLLTADQITKKLNGLERNEIPIGCNHLTMFIDVQGKLLFHSVTAWEDDFTGYSIDYGAYPEQNTDHFTLREAQHTIFTPGTGQEGAIYAALESVVNKFATHEYRRGDGADMKLDRILIDANWGISTDIVYQFCKQSPHSAILMPSHGIGVGASSIPFSGYKKKTGDRVGHNWRVPNVQGKRAIRHVLFDANYWKSFIQARLSVKMGDKGCLSLYGHDPNAHRLLSEHLTAEYRIKTEGRGRKVDEWKEYPDKRDNHWLDCFVGCAVAASMQGAVLLGTDALAAKPRGKRVSFAELQRKARGTSQ